MVLLWYKHRSVLFFKSIKPTKHIDLLGIGGKMRISTKGRYSISMLVYLAQHRQNGFITLREIADNLKISKKYLEQIVPVLSRGGLLQTNRGFQGGYRLSTSPEKCSLGAILRMTESSLSPVSDSGFNNDDPTYYVWSGLNGVINDYLDSISIQDIVDSIIQSYANDYVI